MELLINGKVIMEVNSPKEYSPIEPRYEGCCVDVGVDQSKSHTAIVIGPAGSGYSDYIEILGGGGSTNVYDVCAFTRSILKDLFKDATFRLIGVEDPITKNVYRDKNGKQKMTGMDTHENRLKLSAIFDNYMFTFYDLSGKHPMRVNNNDWKMGILPEEYRKKSHDKGSYDWHCDRRTQLAYTNDNVTDAACILDYIRKLHKEEVVTKPITTTEIPKKPYKYLIRDYNAKVDGNIYQYNHNFSFTDNMAFVSNRLVNGVGMIVVPIEFVPIAEFYKDICKLQHAEASAVFVLVGGA